MEWWIVLLIIFGSLLILMASGMPVAFCFLVVCIVGVWVYWGGHTGLYQLILSFNSSIAVFTMLPLPLFILMGEVMFESGVAPLMIDALDKWLGRLPGRLSLLAVGAGTVLSTLTGASMASVAILGSTLAPEMERRGYQKSMSLGPILGSSGLAIMIPPSGLAVLLATIGQFSIGKFLIAIIVPGILLALLFAAYIIVRCYLQPSIAPTYQVAHSPLSEKVLSTVRYILPIGIIVFLVIGVIILGIATPTEAAATGALGCFLLAAIYKKFNWIMTKKAVRSTVQMTGMMFLIIAGSTAFSQILAFSGANTGLSHFAMNLAVSPIFIIIAMQIVGIILGMFISVVPIIMICTPIFMPVVLALGYDPIWFGTIFLMNMQMGALSPPFGLDLFVMKSVASPDTTMDDIWRAAIPFIAINILAMAMVIVSPALALWLPSLMR